MRISHYGQRDGYDASTCYDAVGSEIRNLDQFQKLTILKVMTLCVILAVYAAMASVECGQSTSNPRLGSVSHRDARRRQEQRDTGPVERDTSPVERDTSQVERDTSPVERDTSPMERDTSPVERDT
jgi:hypothetical protein